VKIVKVPCTGRVDTIHILEAFEGGADGVCLVGCLEGDCHYISGNIRARKRVEYARHLLDEAGIGGARLAMYNLSSADGPKFARVTREITDRIRELGPNPTKTVASLKSQVSGSGPGGLSVSGDRV
jgi:coenzyme F420-reducing hydrogenase delta subunit